MTVTSASMTLPTPTIVPLGDSALLVRFATTLGDAANRAAIALSVLLDQTPIAGVTEVMPNLVSVLLRYDPLATSVAGLQGELRLRLSGLVPDGGTPKRWTIPVTFDGPDLEEVVAALGLSVDAFVAAHNRAPLRVLATGFAPGFVYCGLHGDLDLPRRQVLRSSVPAGSVLFAAGQTAIAATDMPTGWHMIGRTDFRNFDPSATPPTRLGAGDEIAFVVAP